MSQYNDVLYGVEPYTGKIICHAGVQGMAWGFSKGVANGLRKAIGKFNPATGQYIYDKMKAVGNSYVGQRLKNDQLGSRTMKNIGRAAGNAARSAGRAVGNVARSAGRASRYAAGRIASGQFGSRTINNAKNLYDSAKTGIAEGLINNKLKNTTLYDIGSKLYKTTNKYKRRQEEFKQRRLENARKEREERNKKAMQALERRTRLQEAVNTSKNKKANPLRFI